MTIQVKIHPQMATLDLDELGFDQDEWLKLSSGEKDFAIRDYFDGFDSGPKVSWRKVE